MDMREPHAADGQAGPAAWPSCVTSDEGWPAAGALPTIWATETAVAKFL